jgi:hypothetical protein
MATLLELHDPKNVATSETKANILTKIMALFSLHNWMNLVKAKLPIPLPTSKLI